MHTEIIVKMIKIVIIVNMGQKYNKRKIQYNKYNKYNKAAIEYDTDCYRLLTGFIIEMP